MKVELHYGTKLLSLQIPRENIEQFIQPWQDQAADDNAVLLSRVMTDEETEDFQKEIAGRRLCILTEDCTRDAPLDDILEQLCGLLPACSQVLFIICTGTHETDTAQNNQIKEQIKKSVLKAGIENYHIHTHDCQQDEFIKAGSTTRGTEVLFNALADDAEVFLVLSDMKTHYFSGYSNPIKNFVPGICAYRTTEQNHSLALDEDSTFGLHPWHSDQRRTGNPVAADQLEGMKLIVRSRPVYALATISASRKIQWARLGPVEPVTKEAFDKIDSRNTHTVKPVPRLIVSPGGFPNDTSLYIAQRALELTKNAITKGGEVLFLAACQNGIGEERTMENFYNRLTDPIEQILKSILAEYKLYTHKPYKFAQMIQKLRRIWIHSQIPDELLEAAHLFPTDQPQSIVDNWLAEEPDTKIIIVDGANKIALYGSTSLG